MVEVQRFLSEHGSLVLVALVFASGLGLPVPGPPVLLAAGVLAGSGKFSLGAVFAGSLLALVLTDLLWDPLRRSYCRRRLSLLGGFSLEPVPCAPGTGTLFPGRRGVGILFAMFVPGLKTVAPPLAGMLRMRVPAFLAYDGVGAFLWVGAFMAVGVLFSDQVARAPPLSGWLLGAVRLLFAVLLGWEYFARWRV